MNSSIPGHKLCGGSLPVSKDYKARFRSLMFNLKDEKNPDFMLHSCNRSCVDLARRSLHEQQELVSNVVRRGRG